MKQKRQKQDAPAGEPPKPAERSDCPAPAAEQMLPSVAPSSSLLERLSVWAALALCLGLLGRNNLHGLWEQDVWWQVRLGDELWQTWRLQREDQWSYTVPGIEWYNIYWISTLLLSLAHNLGGIALLVALRAFFGGLLHLALCDGGRVDAASLLVGTVGAVVCQFRVQIRPEIFVLVLLAAVTARARGGARSFGVSLCVAICITANLHYGFVIFAVVIGAAQIAGRFGPLSLTTWAWAPFVVASAFVCPYPPFYGIKWIGYHGVGYNERKVLTNPEHMSILNEGTRLQQYWYTFAGLSSAVVVLAVLWSLFQRWRAARSEEAEEQKVQRPGAPPGFEHLLIPAATQCLFLYLAVERSRTIPFHVVYITPFVTHQVRRLTSRFSGWLRLLPVFLCLGLSVAGCAYHQWKASPPSLGISSSVQWPVGSAHFVNEFQPIGNVYHTFDFGNYLVYHTPQYKVFGDTRETIFQKYEQLYFQAYSNPGVLLHILTTFKVNTVVTKIPDTQLLFGKYWRDVQQEFLPKEDWAMVWFDDVSVVLVRRGVPEHKDIIERFEYHYLVPNLPHDHYVRRDSRQANTSYEKELGRCLSERRWSDFPVYCKLAKIAYDRSWGRGETEMQLEELRRLAAEASRRSWKEIWRNGISEEYQRITNNIPETSLKQPIVHHGHDEL